MARINASLVARRQSRAESPCEKDKVTAAERCELVALKACATGYYEAAEREGVSSRRRVAHSP